MATAVQRRGWPALTGVLAGGVWLAGAAALPLGLDRVGAAPLVASGVGLRPLDADGAARPLALILVRACAWLPLGDLATRANLASAVLAALAAALLGRAVAEALAGLRPPANARQTARELWHEPVAAGGGAAVVVLSFGVFLALSSASNAAVSVALAAAVWQRALRLARAPGSASDGLALCFLAGLAAGADPAAALVLWPPAFLLWLWALRRGERWALLGPVLGVAGAAIVLYAVAVSGGAFGAAQTFARVVAAAGGAEARAAGAVAREVAAQLGVVALLVGAVGLGALVLRAPFAAALAAGSTALALLAAASVTTRAGRVDDGAAGWALLMAALALPVGAGIAQMAAKLGPARVAAAAVIAVIAAAWPALDGGAWRWRRDVRLPERLLAEALAPLPPRASVDPGSAQMRALFAYAAALGLRPDLVTRPRP